MVGSRGRRESLRSAFVLGSSGWEFQQEGGLWEGVSRAWSLRSLGLRGRLWRRAAVGGRCVGGKRVWFIQLLGLIVRAEVDRAHAVPRPWHHPQLLVCDTWVSIPANKSLLNPPTNR